MTANASSGAYDLTASSGQPAPLQTTSGGGFADAFSSFINEIENTWNSLYNAGIVDRPTISGDTPANNPPPATTPPPSTPTVGGVSVLTLVAIGFGIAYLTRKK